MKPCNTCHVPKPLSEFYKRGDKDGYRPNCKECYKKKTRLSTGNDKEKARVAATEEKEAIEAAPEKYLVGRICWQAGQDKDIEFLNGEWFNELCDLASFEPDDMRKLCNT